MPPSGTLARPHGIEDEGTPLGQKPKLNFVGAGVSVANVGTKTVVTIPAGGPQGEPGEPGPEGPPGADGADGDGSEIDVKGFRSINAYGAVQGVASAQNAAIEACQDALVADGGGVLFQPGGVTYATPGITQRAKVTWMGAGSKASTWGFNLAGADTGAGTYAILPASANSPLRISGTRVVGPASTLTIGVDPCGISAVKVSRDSLIDDVFMERFHAGLGMWGDHITLDKVLVQNCLYGADYISSSSRGDHSYRDCIFSGNLLAGIFIGLANEMNHSVLHNVHFVSTPFGILRTGTANAGFMNNVRLDYCAWENVGNGAIADLGNSGDPSFVHCIVNGSSYVQENTYKYAGLASNYAIDLAGSCVGGYIRNDYYPFTNGALGAYHFGTGYVPVISDFPTDHSLNMFGASPGAVWDQSGGRGQRLHFSRVAAAAISVGDIVERVTSTTVQRATGTSATKLLDGVAVLAAPTSPWPTLVQRTGGEGGFVVLSETVSAAMVPLAQKTGAYNVVGPASSYPSNPIIGYSLAAGGNAGATATVLAALDF